MADIDDGVVQVLYRAGAGEVPWHLALGALQANMDGVSTQLVVFNKLTGTLALAEHAPGRASDAILEHVREYHRCDPHIAHVAAQPVGEVLNTLDSFPLQEYRDHRFYREYWAAYDVVSLLGAKVAENDEFVAMIGMSRTRDVRQYSRDDVALFRRYMHHLKAAFEIAKFLAKMRAEAIVGQRLMQSSPRPMILLAHDQTVLATNDAATLLLQSADACHVRDGQFHCRANDSAAQLLEVIAAFNSPALSDAHQPRRDRRAFRIHGADGSPVWCSAWDMRPDMVMGLFGPAAAVLLTLTPQQFSQPADPLWLGSMFDLTPAEARVAGALMTGAALESIAAQHRVSLGTVRAQLRSIYAKTGTHRQAQLVALLLGVSNP